MDNEQGDRGGALQPGERCTKKGGRVMKVLRTNHLESRTPTAASLDSYLDRPPDIFPVDITNDTVTAVVWRLLGGAVPEGMDSVSLQHWLLRFGAASGELRLIVGDFTEWMSNGWPQWAAYCAMMRIQMIALDKQTGIRQVGVVENWRQLMVKCLLRMTIQEARAACRMDQMAGGVDAGIEGGIHDMGVL